MSTVTCHPNGSASTSSLKVRKLISRPFPLHRLGMVRRRERVSRRAVAHRLDISLDEVKDQEIETADIPISILHRWREVLDVPMIELLAEPDDFLCPSLRKRAQLVRVMKTAKAILQRIEQTPVKRLAQRLVEQLTEIMPELRDISSGHLVGQRRSRNEYGRAAEFSMPEEMFFDRRD